MKEQPPVPQGPKEPQRVTTADAIGGTEVWRHSVQTRLVTNAVVVDFYYVDSIATRLADQYEPGRWLPEHHASLVAAVVAAAREVAQVYRFRELEDAIDAFDAAKETPNA